MLLASISIVANCPSMLSNKDDVNNNHHSFVCSIADEILVRQDRDVNLYFLHSVFDVHLKQGYPS